MTQNIKNILFLDIETISCVKSFEELDDRLKPLWERKAQFINKEQDKESLFFEKAGIYAEFGTIINISIGSFFQNPANELCFKVKSFSGKDEARLLKEFRELLVRFDQKRLRLCAHNGKEFDFPYICRRMLINSIEIPEVLRISGKKPWEINHLDTLELWKFGDKKNYTSLDLLAALFKIPTSKNGFDGSMVNDCFYNQNDLEKIARYCEKDVVLTAQLFLKFKNLPIVSENNIFFA
ncbi:MAG: 3'-5' exonuclease [Cytophagaceae bacterium]|nr:3'-5' exonuclease [Cytophagaceae bacterium]